MKKFLLVSSIVLTSLFVIFSTIILLMGKYMNENDESCYTYYYGGK